MLFQMLRVYWGVIDMIKRVIIGAICVILFAGIMFVPTYFSNEEADKQLEKQATVISELEMQLQSQQTANNTAQKLIVKDKTGVDADRVMSDEKLVTDLFKTCFTWSTSDEYIAARKKVMDKYNLSEDSAFMSTFLPNVSRKEDEYGNVSTMIGNVLFDFTVDGHYHNEGLNMSFSDLKTTLVDISKDTDVYSYIATVTVKTVQETQTGYEYEGESHCLVEYSTSSKGNIFNINAAMVK